MVNPHILNLIRLKLLVIFQYHHPDLRFAFQFSFIGCNDFDFRFSFRLEMWMLVAEFSFCFGVFR